MRFHRNVDEEIRRAERAAATGDPQAIAAFARERLRRGLPVAAWELQAVEPDPRERLRYLIAAREELPDYTDIERRYRDALGEVNIRAMAALRSLAPRVRRSRRRDLAGLEAWAVEVVGQAVVDEVMGSFRAEQQETHDRYATEGRRIQERRSAIDVLMHQVAWRAEARRGGLEVVFTFRATSTHATVGLGAEGYARDSARSDMVFLASQGFESRMEREPGTLHERPYARSQWDRSYRSGDGYRVFVLGVLELLDMEILGLRRDGWTYPSHYFGHEEYFRGSITQEQQSAWMTENFEMLGWDRSYGHDGRAMTVERMKQIYAERGPLKPSWLIPA
jgi:hypothetical protein